MDCARRVVRVSFGAVGLLSILLVSGCRVGPDYVPPTPSVPDQWHQKTMEGLTEGSASLDTWWKVFDDPVLEKYMREARTDNLNLKAAYSRVMESLAILGVASGTYWPQLDAVGEYYRSRASDNGPLADLPGGGDTNNLYFGGLDATWEIDVFGRISRSVEAASAQMEASVEDYRGVLVALYSQIAQSYIDLRAIQARIQYAQANISLQKNTLKLTQDRRKLELVPELDVQQATLNLSVTQARLPDLRRLEAWAIHRLGVLLGKPPATLYNELSVFAKIPAPPESVTMGLPAELLRQRPDVRQAERRVAAQTALVGVATANLYPVFSLSGTFALESLDLKDAADWDSHTWGFGPSFRWNLFDGKRIRNAIKVREAQTEQAVIAYEQTVLRALEDVENSMVAYTREKQRAQALQRSVDAAKKSVDLVKSLYEIGLTDFQNVLDMERTLAEQEDQLADSQGMVAKYLVRLYAALGGGWSVEKDSVAQAKAPATTPATNETGPQKQTQP